MSRKNHLSVLEKRIIYNLDFRFLGKIKEKLPYHNAYFLVCMAETLHNFIDEEKHYDTFNEALQALIDKASELYLTINISTVFIQ